MSRTRRAHLKVGVVGLGYMGLATALAFAAHNLPVAGYDSRPEIRQSILQGRAPYYEPGLVNALRIQLRSGRLEVFESLKSLVRVSQVIFLCVPTPSLRSGRSDLRSLKIAAAQIGSAIESVVGYRLIVIKSTVVPRSTEGVVADIIRRRSGRTPRDVGIAANPEFLAEGTMVRDSTYPDRIVLGTSDSQSLAWLRRTYRSFQAPIFNLSPAGAELVKYAANAFLAQKVSFANEISRLADRLGVNVDAVMAAVGHDPRIGERFLRAGPGFGGSCFEKDLRALVTRSKELGFHFRSAEAALRINEEQLAYAMGRIRAAVGPLSGKKVALLGLSFKAGTDDVRESRALLLARELVNSGAIVQGHDPVSLENFRHAWAGQHSATDGKLELCDSVEKVLDGVDAAILQADWPIYEQWHPAWTRRMKRPLLVDLRRALDPRVARRAGLTLIGLGAGSPDSCVKPEIEGRQA